MNPLLSRRSFLAGTAAVAAVAGTGLPKLAAARQVAAVRQVAAAPAPVLINANEYPGGPCPAALEAIERIAPQGGRYLFEMALELFDTLSRQLNVPTDHLMAYPGSSPPLDFAMLAFTSPEASLVTADPTFESGWEAAARNGARVIKVPARADDSHDVEAMCAADPKAGVIYICNPNNPTGAVTARGDIEYALQHKPRGSVLVVDEAYIHFSESAASAVDLVAAGEDVVVLRTFSKLYGMAGIRLGYVVARPALLQKIKFYGVNSLPVTAMAAGLASLRDPDVVPQRRRDNTALRTATVQWLQAQGYECTRSESNCFMLDVKRPAKEFIDDMATHGVMVGRSWPGFPTRSRITVGTAADMDSFRRAFALVAQGRRGPLPVPRHPGMACNELDRHRLLLA
ncbi:MAG: pyridoxal phosphate-dependent aminotransferase [Pseudoxanthomonas sp.]